MSVLQSLGRIDEAKEVAAGAIVAHQRSAAVWEECLKLAMRDSATGDTLPLMLACDQWLFILRMLEDFGDVSFYDLKTMR